MCVSVEGEAFYAEQMMERTIRTVFDLLLTMRHLIVSISTYRIERKHFSVISIVSSDCGFGVIGPDFEMFL